jgi:DNA polymerase (family 10)
VSTVNEELVSIFEDMAYLLERKGDLIFKIRAYQRAAEIISDFPEPLDAPSLQGQDLMKVLGIGKAISGKIREYITSGQISAYERLKAEFPELNGTPAKHATPLEGGRSH